jgi:hypothetical protein
MTDTVTKKTDFFSVYSVKNSVGGGSFGEVFLFNTFYIDIDI